MQKLTVNRGNWTGKDGTVTVLSCGRFRIEDLDGTFRLEEKTGTEGKYFVVTDNQGTRFLGYPFNTIKGEHTEFYDGSVIRANKNPFVAFAQLAWSIY